MLQFVCLILGIFLSTVVSAVANEHVQILADEEISIVPGPDGRNVIPVVQTIDGIVTTYYYTIIGEQTIVNGEESTTIDGVDDDLAEYPNIANAMRNMDAFENMLARILEQNPEFGMMVDSQSEPPASAAPSASASL
ncbi:hypothetical protein MBANPS3_010656 [Mucor bainieri]